MAMVEQGQAQGAGGSSPGGGGGGNSPAPGQPGGPMTYEQWNATYGGDIDKLVGVTYKNQEQADAHKQELFGRYQAEKGVFNDKGSYEYGGAPGMAAQWSGAFGKMNAEQRGIQNKMYAQGGEDRANALAARGQQLSTADMILARARGQTPSIAQMQADRQMGQLAAEQTSQAASARGPAALALAQQNQANATATGQSAISGQAQINAAMERERAEQAAFGAYSGIRGQDQQGQGMSYQAAGQAGATGVGYGGLAHGVNTAQLAAQGNKESQKSANRFGQASIDAQNQARQDANTNAAIGATATLGMGAMMMSDERAKVPVGQSPGIAPGESFAAPTTYEQSRQAALEALERDEARARTFGRPEQQLPKTYGGVEAIDRYEQDKLDTVRAKERHGLEPTQKEQTMRVSQEYSEKRAKRQNAEPKQGPTEHKVQELHTDRATKNAAGWSRDQMDGLKTMASAGQGYLARGQGGGGGGFNFYTPPQQQQIVSDMGAKRMGSADFISDMGAKRFADPYSDERAKRPVSFGFGGGEKRRGAFSPEPQQPSEEDQRVAGFTRALGTAPSPVTKGPDAGFGHMFQSADTSPMATSNAGASAPMAPANRRMAGGTGYRSAFGGGDGPPGVGGVTGAFLSDMGAKQEAPMLSDDRTKLLQAYTAGRQSGQDELRADIEKTSKLSPGAVERYAKRGDPAAETIQGAVKSESRRQDATPAEKAIASAQSRVRRSYTNQYGKDQPLGQPLMSREPEKRQLVTRTEPQLASGKDMLSVQHSAYDAEQMQKERAMRQDLAYAQPKTLASGERIDSVMPSDERAKSKMSDAEASALMKKADVAFGRSGDGGLKKEADRQIANMKADRPASVRDPMANAARSMEASPYAYKEEFRPPEQAPGEVNVGPMAQKMAADPVARTAVRKDPQTGLLSLDRDKMLKVTAGSIASQQKQLDDLNRKADALMAEKRGEHERAMAAPPAVRDRENHAPHWLSRYMADEDEAEQRKKRLGMADFMPRGKRRSG